MHVLEFQWLEKEFLGYLTSWKADVDSHTSLSADARNRMMLSRETREGLEITGMIHVYNYKHSCI